MRFAKLLSSHLTPEWRAHYIDYDALKVLLYRMVSLDWTKKDDDDLDELTSAVDVDRQDEFFTEIQRQLGQVDSFFRAREAELSHQLNHYLEEVDVLSSLLSNPRTRNIRSTNRKRNSLIKAFCEFYLHLSLLQNFQQLNHTGFRKILKKHDKLAQSERGGRLFKEDVDKSYFCTSKEVNTLIKRTEDIMINQLENGNRRRAMAKLRIPPLRGESSHWHSCLSGLFMGIIIASFVVAIIALGFRLHFDTTWSPSTGVLLGLRSSYIVFIWFFGFAINTFIWRQSGVNNILIFEFDPRHNLNYQQLFEVASAIGVVWCCGVLIFMFSEWDLIPIPQYIGPLFTWIILIVLFVIPVPVYHRTRIWLFKRFVRILLAPFFHVTFADFWIADQFNTLSIVLLDIEYFICYLVYGQNASPTSLIQCGTVYYGLRPLLAMMPAWWRFAQCLRRYYNTKQAFPHLVNAGKYSTSFVVVILSTIATVLHDKESDTQSPQYYVFFVLWLISGVVNSCYTFAWDIKMDWGFFEEGFLIRREIIYPSKYIHAFAIIEDLILRLTWTFTISVGEGGSNVLNNNILKTILATLEVVRRIVWNFFRLENEHLNNCGQFRAVRDISVYPLDPSEIEEPEEDRGHVMRQIRRKASFILGLENDGIRNLRRRASRNERRAHETNFSTLPFDDFSLPLEVPLEVDSTHQLALEDADSVHQSEDPEHVNSAPNTVDSAQSNLWNFDSFHSAPQFVVGVIEDHDD